jgi:bifunctional enzyme CysN/CysC
MSDEPLHVPPRLLAEARHADGVRTVQAPKYVVNVNTMEHLAAKTLELNAIGVVQLATDKPVVFEAYTQNRTLGGFILIDKITTTPSRPACCTSRCGAAQNVHWQALDITVTRTPTSRTRSPPCCGSRAFRAG